MNTSTGKEAWLGYGLGGMLLYNLSTVPAEQYLTTLIAGCGLAILAGAQRTFVKWLEVRYNKQTTLEQAESIEAAVRGTD
jgi:tRNA1(Val) A37 N6-methylase TrmN6